MSPFRWFLLCIVFTLYLLLGGSIFMLIEQHHEIHQKEELHVLRQDIREILFRLDHNFYNNWTSPEVLDALTSAKEGVVNRISAVCGLDNLLEDTGRPEPNSLKWNYYNSVFFAFTVVTTIGYGHLSPSTNLSKIFMMVYALFGIPINGILLSGVGDYFSNKLVKVHQKSKQKQYRGKCTLVFEIIFYLIPGIVVFIIIPAGVFVLIENWTFLDSIYFAFVSLTTIGFGDYVAGMGDGHNIWLWIYKAFLIIWITFGLGYLIMILGFIAKGMKSKQVRGVLEKRLTGIRSTKEKLTKDIDYMKRIVNELYLMRVKPEYDLNDAENEGRFNGRGTGGRSLSTSCVHFERRYSSLPRLPTTDGDDEHFDIVPYGKTPSKMPGRGVQSKRMRRHSDTELPQAKWDEEFWDRSGSDSITREELLATVVNALSGNVMKDVMNAVEELNQYEQDVAHEHAYGPVESTEDTNGPDDVERISGDSSSGDMEYHVTAPPWELGAVSESDERILLDGNSVSEKAQTVVVHTVDETDKSLTPSFIDKVTGAIRKISGTMTPPESPSRKISRNESDSKRKISRAEHEKPCVSSRPHHLHHPNPQYSPFARRLSSIRRSSRSASIQEADPKHSLFAKNPRRGSNTSDMRKISQESHLSTVSNSSYKTIDEIINSARASRKNTPAAQYFPTTYGDQVDGKGVTRPETDSLVNLLKALDSVQDRLNKTSVASDASFSGSYLSDHSNSADLSNSFAPSSTANAISSRHKRESTTQDVVDRRRKVGIFQPGFSYVNFGFNPDEVEPSPMRDDSARKRSSGKKSEDGRPRSRKSSSAKNDSPGYTSKKR